jgi:hypothetical protein
MLIGLFNQEFLAHNALRSYPLSERATKTPGVGGDFRIPDSLFVGAKLTLTASAGDIRIDEFYISRLTIYPTGINVVVSYAGQEVGTCAFTVEGQEVRNVTAPVIGLGNFYGLGGHVTLGSFEQARFWPGDYKFNLDGGRLDPDVIHYSAVSVTSVRIVNKKDSAVVNQYELTGRVNIVGDNESGIKVDVKEANEFTTVTITKNCPTADFGAIKTINFISPDKDGNIQLESLTPCLEVAADASDHKLTVTETCCSPCCGCEELEELEQTIAELRQSTVDIRMFQQKLESALDQLATSLNITGI